MSEKKGSFEDLYSLELSDIEKKLDDMKFNQAKLRHDLDDFEQQYQDLKHISKALELTYDNLSKVKGERGDLLRTLRKLQEEAEKQKSIRDEINSKIILIGPQINQQLETLYGMLTGEIVGYRYPSLKKEKEYFSRLMELQSMHEKKKISTDAHNIYRKKILEQRDIVTQLDNLRNEKDGLETETPRKGQSKSVNAKNIFKNLSRLEGRLFGTKRKLRKLTKEIGRHKAYLKNRKNSRMSRRSVEEILSSVKSGEVNTSLSDLTVLLNKGVVKGDVTYEQKEKKSRKKRKPKKNKKGAVSRGKPRTGRSDFDSDKRRGVG